MAYSSYNDVTVRIDGAPFLVESASIDSNASLASDLLIYRKASSDFLPEGPLKGSVKLNYPITGKDHLYQFINSEKSMALDIGGFIINSGYLTSYSFDVSRFSPIKVSVGIDFWGPVMGSFLTRRETTPALRILTSEDLTLSGNSNGINTANSLISLNYSYSSSVESDILVGSSEPSSIRFLQKEISLDLESYDPGGLLPYTGLPADFDIGFSGNGGQTYKIRGILMNKDYSFSLGGRSSYKFSFKQNKIGLAPEISGITRDGTVLTIGGSNLLAVYSVIFHPGITSNYFTNLSTENEIKINIPIGSRNGLITVVSPAGEASHYCRDIPSSLAVGGVGP